MQGTHRAGQGMDVIVISFFIDRHLMLLIMSVKLVCASSLFILFSSALIYMRPESLSFFSYLAHLFLQ